MSDRATRSFSRLRLLSNLAMAALLLLGIDAATAWWRGTQSVTCASAHGLASDGGQILVGITGLIVAMLGIMLGGVRHALTGVGLVLLVAGLLLGGVAPELIGSLCAPP